MSATPEQIDTILDRLGNDAGFRERMLGDPVSALAEHGLSVDPASVPAVRSLPSKEAIETQRAAVQAKVADGANLAIFIAFSK